MTARQLGDRQLRNIFNAFYCPPDGSHPRGVRPATPAERRRIEQIAARYEVAPDVIEQIIYGKPEEAQP